MICWIGAPSRTTSGGARQTTRKYNFPNAEPAQAPFLFLFGEVATSASRFLFNTMTQNILLHNKLRSLESAAEEESNFILSV